MAEQRTYKQLQADRKTVAKMYVAGCTHRDIAEAIDCSPSHVNTIISKLRQEWKEGRPDGYDSQVMDELAKLDNLESQAWSAWQRSCENAVRKFVKEKRNSQSGVLEEVERSETNEGQSGDPRFLEIIKSCIDRRCKLLGLDAPTKIAPVKVDIQGVWRPTEEAKLEVLKFAFSRAGLSAKILQAPETNGDTVPVTEIIEHQPR